MEELVAELGAAFLCADLRITNEPRADLAQYLASWLPVLKADKNAIFTRRGQGIRSRRISHGSAGGVSRPPPSHWLDRFQTPKTVVF
jgi:antirestriction protein ArdC